MPRRVPIEKVIFNRLKKYWKIPIKEGDALYDGSGSGYPSVKCRIVYCKFVHHIKRQIKSVAKLCRYKVVPICPMESAPVDMMTLFDIKLLVYIMSTLNTCSFNPCFSHKVTQRYAE